MGSPIKHVLLFCGALGGLLGLPGLYGNIPPRVEPDRNWWEQFGQTFLPVVIESGNRTADAELMGILGGEIELRPGDAHNPSERVFIPLDDIQEFRLRFEPSDPTQEILERLKNLEAEPKDYASARKTIWPMVPYLLLPEDRFDIHPLVETYFNALIETDQLDEAYALALRIPLARVNPRFVQYTLNLAEKLVADGMNTRGLALLGIMPLVSGDDPLLKILNQYAGNFREQEQLDEALILYDRIRSIPESPLYKEALLWTAYCNVRLDRIQSARLFLDEARPLAPRDAEFSLHQLVLARIELNEENHRQAMEEISQGVVFSRIGYTWIPELLYVSGVCYEALGKPKTALTVYDQLELFFPSQKWAGKGRERRLTLEQKTEAVSDTPEPAS